MADLASIHQYCDDHGQARPPYRFADHWWLRQVGTGQACEMCGGLATWMVLYMSESGNAVRQEAQQA